MLPALRMRPYLETVSATKYQSFNYLHISERTFDFIWHHHPEVELTYIIRGYGVRYVGDSIRPFRGGDLCLIGPDVPHAYGSHPHMRGGAEWVIIQFLPDRFGSDFWKLPDTRSLLKLLNLSKKGIRFHGQGLEKCLLLLQNLDDGKSALERLSDFLKIFGLLGSVEHKTVLNPRADGLYPARIDPRLRKVLAWMESADPDELSQSNAARLIGRSPAAFSRFFRNQTNRTFVRHLNEMRVARACFSLVERNRQITQIAMESGFKSLSNFNRRFKEIIGLSPRDYQASLPL